jgi:hypothetical protein
MVYNINSPLTHGETMPLETDADEPDDFAAMAVASLNQFAEALRLHNKSNAAPAAATPCEEEGEEN